jgi:integrase
MTVPIYKLKDQKYRVIVSWRGKPHERIVNGSRSDAQAYETRFRLELAALDPSEARVAPTFSDFSLSRYRSHAENELRATTWANRKYEIAELCEAFGDVRLTAITTERVEAWRSKRGREVGKRSVNRELMALSAILSYARHLGIPCASPTIRKFKVSKTRRHAEAWSGAEIDRLYLACEETDPALLPLIVFLLNTGCRKAEAIALRWSEVDVKRRLVRIWPRPDDEDDDFDTKSGEPREVPISDALLPFLARAPRPCEWVFAQLGDKKGKRKRKKPHTRYECFPKKRFGDVVKAAGLTGGPHKSRHTFASHFLQTTPDLYLLGRVLGQSQVRVTEAYCHLLQGHYERARGAVSLAPRIGPAGVEMKKRWKQ